MRVLLTQPIISEVDFPPHIPDLGMGYIASSLERNGHEVHLNDWNGVKTAQELQGLLASINPEVVGVKVFTKDFAAASKTVSLIRDSLPDVYLVVGGPHPSCSDPVELVDDFPSIDFAIRGEAECSFRQLLALISATSRADLGPDRSSALHSIPGLVWREDGIVKHNPIEFEYDLDNLGKPLWEKMNPQSYEFDLLAATDMAGSAVPIITTRGCPGKCSFCSAHLVNGRKIRTRSPADVVAEIVSLHDTYGIKKFSFQDNCFTSNRNHLKNICEALSDAALDIQWDCNCYERLDSLDEDMVALMYASGCRMIHMGIESASEKTRASMNKQTSLGEYTRTIKLLRNHNIAVGGWFLIGFPDESLADMLQTISYAVTAKTEVTFIGICYPLPGSEVHGYLKEKFNTARIDWKEFNLSHSQYPISRLTSTQLRLLLKFARLLLAIKKGARRSSRSV